MIWERDESTRHDAKRCAPKRKESKVPERVIIPLRPPPLIAVYANPLEYDQIDVLMRINWSVLSPINFLLGQNLISLKMVHQQLKSTGLG